MTPRLAVDTLNARVYLMDFSAKLAAAAERNESLLCIGLDPDPKLMPQGVGVAEFNAAIIDVTCDLVCAYKPNLAFYEALDGGMEALQKTLANIPPHIPVIADAKRGDIGNTARAYAAALFDRLGFDAATVSPYLGEDSIEPFTAYKGKGVFVLARTSNRGAADLQELAVSDGSKRLWEVVADMAARRNTDGNVGLVVGATCPEALKAVRKAHPDMTLLIPGIGAQGGDLKQAVTLGVGRGRGYAVFNSSRGVLYASKVDDFARAAREAALKLRREINSHLP